MPHFFSDGFSQFINILCGMAKEIKAYRPSVSILQCESRTSYKAHVTKNGQAHQGFQEFQSVGLYCLK